MSQFLFSPVNLERLTCDNHTSGASSAAAPSWDALCHDASSASHKEAINQTHSMLADWAHKGTHESDASMSEQAALRPRLGFWNQPSAMNGFVGVATFDVPFSFALLARSFSSCLSICLSLSLSLLLSLSLSVCLPPSLSLSTALFLSLSAFFPYSPVSRRLVLGPPD